MSAGDSLSPEQFRMPMEEFKGLRSSDWGVPMHEALGHMEANYRNFARNGFPEAHEAEIEHGGPRAYIDHLKADIAKNGLQEPPTVRLNGMRGAGMLVEGHHRGLALMELGGDDVPVQAKVRRKRP